ncbi:MAG: hypothetical protein U9Q06_04510 [Nanoarchaeota archaeon]|nr:hypothetical protein [Nanoarchaeota archaeon]
MMDYNFVLKKKDKLDGNSKYKLPRDKPNVLDNYRYDLEFQRKLNFDKRKYHRY